MSFRRGADWFVDVPGGRRQAARITSAEKKRSLPTAVRLDAGDAGLDHPGYVLCHDLYTIDRDLFRRYSGTLPLHKVLEVEDALRRALDLT